MRIGYDSPAGFLAGGFPAWSAEAQETGSFEACTVQDLHAALDDNPPFILDVRDIGKFRSAGHISGAHHVYVGELPRHLGEIPRDRPVAVTCDAGFKGSLAASYLEKNGFSPVMNLLGGMQAWERAGYPLAR
jgi:hydroxyacylglutathione hydrolase